MASTDVVIRQFNNVHVKVLAEKSTMQELADVFTFMVPGHKHMQKFKTGRWDGKIRLLDKRTGLIYVGLVPEIERFCKLKSYTIDYLEEDDGFFKNESFSLKEAQDFIETLRLPKELHGQKFEIRDYQMKAFIDGVRSKRMLFLSPTASGKSLMIYMLVRKHCMSHKTLIIVPTTTLVHQLNQDFIEYGWGKSGLIYEGQSKDWDGPVVISTWQSIYDMPREWFSQFGMVIGDEAHQFKAMSLKTIMEKLDSRYRFGFTGTLDGSLTNEMVLRGLFGDVNKITTTMELMKNKQVAQFRIKAIVLSYTDEERQMMARQ